MVAAERDADADLARPRRRDVAGNTVDPDRRQRHRQSAEQRKESHTHPLRHEQVADPFFEQFDIVDRKHRIDRLELFPHQRDQRFTIIASAHQQMGGIGGDALLAGEVLVECEVYERGRLLLNLLRDGILDDTDDGPPGVAHLEAAADRIRVLPSTSGPWHR